MQENRKGVYRDFDECFGKNNVANKRNHSPLACLQRKRKRRATCNYMHICSFAISTARKGFRSNLVTRLETNPRLVS